MVQEIELYDPQRRPSDWTELLRPGQYAVFHRDVATDVERRSDGHYLGPEDKSTCLIFDSLPEAENYCEVKVEEIPRLRCDIYDHAGKSKAPMLTYVNKRFLKSPQKHVYWGWILIAASLPCFWIEWHWNHTLLIPTIIGINLVFAGLRLIYWGAGGSEKRRSAREH